MEHLESKIPPPSSSSPSSFLLRNKKKGRSRTDIHHNDTSVRSHYSNASTTTNNNNNNTARRSAAGGSAAARSSSSILVDPPTTVHLTDDDDDDDEVHGKNNNNNDKKLIGDSILTMDEDEYYDEDYTEGYKYGGDSGGNYQYYSKKKKAEEKIVSSTRTRDTAALPPPPPSKANHFSFSPSRTDQYYAYAQSGISSSSTKPEQRRRTGSIGGDNLSVDNKSSNDVHNNKYCLHGQRRDQSSRHRDVYQLVSSFKTELDKISAEADDAAKKIGVPPSSTTSSSSRRRRTPPRFSGLSVNAATSTTGKKYHSRMTTPASTTTPATGFNSVTKNDGSVATTSFVSPQGPEPYPTPPPPRPVETPSTIRQQQYGSTSSTVRSEERSVPLVSSRSTATRSEATAKDTATRRKYTPDGTTAAHNSSYNSGGRRNVRDTRDMHQNIDQLKTTIQLQDLELDELRRENERLKIINNSNSSSNNKTPSSSSDKKKENKAAPSGSIHSYYDSSSSSFKTPGQQHYSETSQKSKATWDSAGRDHSFVEINTTNNRFEHNLDTHYEEEVDGGDDLDYENYGTPLYRRGDDDNYDNQQQQQVSSLFSPGTRCIAKLARHMRLDDDHFVPLSEIIDRHWDKISATTASENENRRSIRYN